MSNNPCSDKKVEFYNSCKLSETQQKNLDNTKKSKPWVKMSMSIIGAGIGMYFGGAGGAMMGAMVAGGTTDGSYAAATKVNNERETCGKAGDLCAINQAVQATIDTLLSEKDMNNEIAQNMIRTVNTAMRDYFNKSQDIRAYYAEKQRNIALMGWRVAIVVFFIVLFDILNIWPMSKIWNPTDYGNIATKSNVKSMLAAFKKNIKSI